ncbi:MAG: flotillin-like protein FloA, partial [Phycisphaerales bacterium]
ALVIGFKVWSRSPIARRMVLGGSADAGEEDGATAGGAAGAPAVRPGDRGVALTGLRPVGFARLGESRIEVTAEFGLVDAGAEVEVTSVSGDRVTVRARGEQSAAKNNQTFLLPQLAQAPAGGASVVFWVILAVVGLIGLVMLIVISQYIQLAVQAWLSGAPVSLLKLVMMRLRKVAPSDIVFNRISAKKAGLDVDTDQLESHYLAGGDIERVVRAMIAADKAKIELPWDRATAIDLAGRDILDAVKTSVDPKVIDCPSVQSGRQTIDAVAKDGIQLKARARVTVRTNISRLVGGATEETIIARVGEGIISTIGSAEDHKSVLENPDKISKTVLAKGLDSGTAFEILSIDIADIDVGENIGANLQTAQAEADTKRFQAQAEQRRALAVAQEAEFQAEEQKNRALVVLAEAEVPKAISEALRKGNMGLMDYYRMQNVMADTSMR